MSASLALKRGGSSLIAWPTELVSILRTCVFYTIIIEGSGVIQL